MNVTKLNVVKRKTKKEEIPIIKLQVEQDIKSVNPRKVKQKCKVRKMHDSCGAAWHCKRRL